MSFLDDAISSIGQQLAKTAAEKIQDQTGINAGAALGYLFGGGQQTGGENMAQLGPAIQQAFAKQQSILTQLQADLFQQSLAIAAIGNQLVGIAQAVSQIKGIVQNIEQMLSKIGQEQLYQEWQAVDTEFTKYIAAINSGFTTYGNYMSNYKTTPASEVSLLVQNILNVNDGPVVGLRAISDFIMGGGQSRSALQLWTQMVSPLVQLGVLDYRLAVQQYFQYYQKLAYAQLRAANLVMEAYNFNNDPTNAKATWTQYNTQLLAQEDVFITWLVPLVYGGVQGGVFQNGGSFVTNFSAYDASAQMNPGVQKVRGDANPGNAFYTPSNIFNDAEQLLANLYVTGSKQRRIVVHMSYPDGFGINPLLNGLFLKIAPPGSALGINPVSGRRLGHPYSYPASGDYSPLYPDQNIYSGLQGFYLKRYVYSDEGGLGDGQYSVADMNGKDGLIALATYLSQEKGLPPVPFQQDSVVNYVMQVNSAKKFDFMNFSAYVLPRLHIHQ